MEQTDTLLNGRMIIQDSQKFMFGIDVVLLSDFAASQIKNGDSVVDLCTGTGIIPLLLETLCPASHFFGLEIQNDMADMAKKSVLKNQLENKIEIICGDLKNPGKYFPKHQAECVTCNPPYTNDSHGKQNISESINIARHEICCNLEDVICAADFLLRPHGKFFMIHRPFRLPEIFSLMIKHNMQPKRMCLVQPSAGKEPNLVMVEARKNAQPRLRIEENICVYGEKGVYSAQVQAIYARQKKSGSGGKTHGKE